MARRKQDEYDWLDDPFDAKKQQQVEEEIRHAKKGSGCAVGAACFLIAVVLIVASLLLGKAILLMVGIFVAGMGVGIGLNSLLIR